MYEFENLLDGNNYFKSNLHLHLKVETKNLIPDMISNASYYGIA